MQVKGSCRFREQRGRHLEQLQCTLFYRILLVSRWLTADYNDVMSQSCQRPHLKEHSHSEGKQVRTRQHQDTIRKHSVLQFCCPDTAILHLRLSINAISRKCAGTEFQSYENQSHLENLITLYTVLCSYVGRLKRRYNFASFYQFVACSYGPTKCLSRCNEKISKRLKMRRLHK